MSMKRFFAFVVPDYFWAVMTPLVVVVTGILQAVLSWVQHRDTQTRVTEVKHNTDGIVSRLQDTITRKDNEADQLATVTDLKTQIAAAKASDREEPK